eukprot:TRINITY_DN194_c2_g1_i1.p1 TRINITY_DN194_c2_g1~~TRINITY_DN194_c2_g1_i1.p1  ORF type:complete len:210 (-),score=47.29 TRINITY_DN194_c2_g1_i1:650-1279(-)
MNNNNSTDFEYFIVLDFEATCNNPIQMKPMEIIEFPCVLLNAATLEIEDRIQFYVKPVINPILSDFCTSLTGITQDVVDEGITFEEALEGINDWIVNKHNLENIGERYAFVTCGDWDLKTMLPSQMRLTKQKVPKRYKKWINIKKVHQKHYKKRKQLGMAKLLKYFNLELVGRHHSGIDDCVNISRILVEMLNDNVPFTADSYSYSYHY